MAIYHFSVKTISRGTGRSAVACSAYRAGEKLIDERQGLVQDYTKKTGVDFKKIYAPEKTNPELLNRQVLWNTVEKVENRKNSNLAREFEIAFPHEFNKKQQEDLLNNLCEKIVQRHGVIVDAVIHAPHTKGGTDDRNYHAHIMFTGRQIDLETGNFAKKRNRDFNKENASQTIQEWRKDFADITNLHLEKNGFSVRVDHRSHEARGVDLEPTIHEGSKVTELRRKGIETDISTLNDNIKSRNEERKNLKRQKELLQSKLFDESINEFVMKSKILGHNIFEYKQKNFITDEQEKNLSISGVAKILKEIVERKESQLQTISSNPSIQIHQDFVEKQKILNQELVQALEKNKDRAIKARCDRYHAEAKAEAEAKAKAEHQAEPQTRGYRYTEAEHKADVERINEINRKIALKRQAEAKAEAEAEAKAKAERQAELKHQAELKRQAELNRQKMINDYCEKVKLATTNHQQDTNFIQTALSYLTDGRLYPNKSYKVHKYTDNEQVNSKYFEQLKDVARGFNNYLKVPYLDNSDQINVFNPLNIKDFKGLQKEMNDPSSSLSINYHRFKNDFEQHKEYIKNEINTLTNDFKILVMETEKSNIKDNLVYLLEEKISSLANGYEQCDRYLEMATAIKDENTVSLGEYSSTHSNVLNYYSHEHVIDLTPTIEIEEEIKPKRKDNDYDYSPSF